MWEGSRPKGGFGIVPLAASLQHQLLRLLLPPQAPHLTWIHPPALLGKCKIMVRPREASFLENRHDWRVRRRHLRQPRQNPGQEHKDAGTHCYRILNFKDDENYGRSVVLSFKQYYDLLFTMSRNNT
mmetsp:Transcript_17157/g.39734  ORF Transcript_17157/g.39734 Transcript_17157/m.39734 type:complete len:127 (-) Transcript_17157:13-393(-)